MPSTAASSLPGVRHRRAVCWTRARIQWRTGATLIGSLLRLAPIQAADVITASLRMSAFRVQNHGLRSARLRIHSRDATVLKP